MSIDYIGSTYDQEIECLIRTLDNIPGEYRRDNNFLVFDSSEHAKANFAHLKHFLFSCKLIEPILDANRIVFTERQHSSVNLSPRFIKKREKHLNKLFRDQVRKLQLILHAENHKYRQRGLRFIFRDHSGIAEIDECIRLFPDLRKGFGLVQYRQIDTCTVELFRLSDVPL